MAGRVATRRVGGGAQLRAYQGRWTPAKRKAFLRTLAQTMNVRESARAVGLGHPGAYKLRKRDPGFARAWDDAISDAYDKVEMLLLERAIAGLEGGAAEPGDTQRLEKLSERTLLGMLGHHRQSVRERREAQARAAGSRVLQEEAEAVERLETKLREMAERMAQDDGE